MFQSLGIECKAWLLYQKIQSIATQKQNEITLRDKILYDIVKLQLSSEPLGHSQCLEMRTNEQNFLENLGLDVEQL